MTTRAEQARQIIDNLIDGEAGITHVYTEKTYPALDDADRWKIELRTTDGAWLTLHMEGINVATLHQCSIPGRVLIDTKNQIAVLPGITGDRLSILDDLVREAHSHAVPK